MICKLIILCKKLQNAEFQLDEILEIGEEKSVDEVIS